MWGFGVRASQVQFYLTFLLVQRHFCRDSLLFLGKDLPPPEVCVCGHAGIVQPPRGILRANGHRLVCHTASGKVIIRHETTACTEEKQRNRPALQLKW